jgi:16S rRNA (cytosine967-C5)-methyltransferase
VTPGRTAALEVFGAVERGQRVDRAFASSASDLDLRERAWCRELVYGAQRLRGRLDYLLDRRVRRGLDSVDAEVLNVLRLGVYQVLYMDGVPEYAAVSQTVDLARLAGGDGASGFVNAIMRATVREKPGKEHFPDFESDAAGFLSTWGSHPRWLIDRWLSRWPAVTVRRLVEANNQVPPIYLRCFRDPPAEAVRRLSDAGIAATAVGFGTECVLLHAGSSPIEAMAVVSSVVQDPAAALVVPFADPAPGDRVADLCSAPGGKAMAFAARGNAVLAGDRSSERLKLVAGNARRLAARTREGSSFNVSVVQADAMNPVVEGAEMILVDVPCTGTGTLRRNPDARWRLTPQRMEELVQLQGRILEATAAVVPDGGCLVYSTCSLESEENEGRIEAFLSVHPEFELEPSSGVDNKFLNERGQLLVLPQKTGFDGAFAARLRKRSGRQG